MALNDQNASVGFNSARSLSVLLFIHRFTSFLTSFTSSYFLYGKYLLYNFSSSHLFFFCSIFVFSNFANVDLYGSSKVKGHRTVLSGLTS